MRILLTLLLILSAALSVPAQYKPVTNILKTNSIFLSNTGSDVVSTQSPDIYLFGNIGNNIVNSFKGDNLYFHLAGIASTAIIVSTNTDYYVHKFFYEHESFGEAAVPIIRAGIYLPFVTGGSLFMYGKLGKDDRAVAASFAVLQSSLITLLYNSLLKAVTGRPNPDWQHNADMKELSKTFRFGFMRGGIFWGWPSGHTASAMAVVSSLTSFYSDKTWLKIAGYSLAAYMMFGVISLHRGGMHWFSDAVAAALMSYAIGSTIGKYYRSKFQPAGTAGELPQGMEIPLLNLRFAF
ncbi:MAG TPA: phosphatase PAP2 family protein [Ignavibacteriaceae bacterium]